MMNKNDFRNIIMESGYFISPELDELISTCSIPCDFVNYILSRIDESLIVIDVKDVKQIGIDQFTFNREFDDFYNFNSQIEYESTKPFKPLFLDNPVEIIKDITGQSTCVGTYKEFINYFRNRYSILSKMIRNRVNARSIESIIINKKMAIGEASIIGMVSDISTTTNGHKLIELEDPTGYFSVLIKESDDLYEEANKLIKDEVIGITGSIFSSGNIMGAKKIIFPDVPDRHISSHSFNNSQENINGKAAFISDVHVGSSMFLENEWYGFVDFLKGDCKSDLYEISKEIRYLVVAGDLVDGIGIFPGQDKELSIIDIYGQYKKAGEYFNEIPEHIKIIIGPGNHDAVRQAEPQPEFPDRIKKYFRDDTLFVGNPAVIKIGGAKVLMYHGRSIDDFVAHIPSVSYANPTTAMVEMLKKRHLSPIYGSRVSIAPEAHDHFIIDQIPDIIHCGHVHTVGAEMYRGVLLLNSGTWQSQTEFQKRVNLIPVPAKIPIVDLSTRKTVMLDFN